MEQPELCSWQLFPLYKVRRLPIAPVSRLKNFESVITMKEDTMLPTQMPLIRVIDPDSQTREFLRYLFTHQGWPVKTYPNVEIYQREDEASRLGIVIVDLNEPTMGAKAFLTRLREEGSVRPVIVLGEGATIDVAVEIMKLEAVDFIAKPLEEKRVLTSVAKQIEDVVREAESQKFVMTYQSLSNREREVIDLSIQGLSHEAVAEKLGITIKTAQVHRYNAYRKLGFHNITEIFHMMTKVGLVKGNEN